MSPIYNYIGNFATGYQCLGLAILLASLTCMLSTIFAFVLFPLDKRRQKFFKYDLKNQAEEGKIQLKDAFYFPSQLWLIIAICVVFYSATFPFISLGKLFFIRKYNLSSGSASLLQRYLAHLHSEAFSKLTIFYFYFSLFFFVTVIASPLFGGLVDRTGFNVIWAIISLVTGILSHGLLMFTDLNVFVPVLLLGSSLSLMAVALWPMVSIIIPKHQLATAYGLLAHFILLKTSINLRLNCLY